VPNEVLCFFQQLSRNFSSLFNVNFVLTRFCHLVLAAVCFDVGLYLYSLSFCTLISSEGLIECYLSKILFEKLGLLYIVYVHN
jgi:hypothetical protein